MIWAIVTTAFLGVLLPLVPNWSSLIAVRALTGISLSGLPAVAMVYLSEEMDPAALGFSMGLYVGGTAIGGMAGRLISGIMVPCSFAWHGIVQERIVLVMVVVAPAPDNNVLPH